jgi:hypothetical protein
MNKMNEPSVGIPKMFDMCVFEIENRFVSWTFSIYVENKELFWGLRPTPSQAVVSL